MFEQIAERFRGRPDSEHEQALLRFCIAAPMALWLLVVRESGFDGLASYRLVSLAIAIEIAIAVAILGWLLLRPGVSRPRRMLGIGGDIGTSCLAMAALGIDAAPLWGVCLWVIVGNGLRFGPRYLLGTMGIALLGFAAVIGSNGEWREHPVLAWTLWGVLLAVPAYLHSLVRSLTEARDAAAEANAAKTWFLASTSHELRTPLNGVVTAVELLRTTAVTKEQEHLVATALQGARTLQGLVGDILDISAIEQGSMSLTMGPARPREIAKNVTMMLSPQARDKGLALEVVVSAEVPDVVELDAARTQQALLALAHNAVKFTDVGSVEIKLAVDAPGWLRFEVRDTGIGIPAEMLPRVFDAFKQIETGAHRRYGGTGIGTTIAKELVERMGGRVFVESEPAVGSRFWFTLPLKAASAVADDDQQRARLPGTGQRIAEHRRRFAPRRVLVVDDLPSNREVLTALLLRAGHEVVEATCAEDALEMLTGAPVHAVIADWHMPGVTGQDFLLEIKAGGHPAGPVPIIVLTADATERTQARAFAAGARAFLTKPISVPGLLDALEDVFLEAVPATSTARPLREAPADGVSPILDETHLLELRETGVSDDRIDHLVSIAIVDLERAMQRAEGALREQNARALAEQAHAMKGVAGNIGARALAEAADVVMRAAQQAQGRALPSDALVALREELSHLRAAVAGRKTGRLPPRF